MTADQFAQWVDAMKSSHGVNKGECAALLGCGRNQVTTWAKRGAPRYIALACAALLSQIELFR